LHPTPVLRAASPTKLVEYMAMGKAVVANDHPEQKRVIEQSGAGYCVPYQEQPFADALVRVLRDPDGAKALGERGRRYVMDHRAYGVIADSVEQRLRQVVAPA
jgi:glycosyltransferase involved in cell wall biosynthesis